MDERIQIFTGDITRLEVDGIVNAANNTLMGGGGVDGAIHKAAGPKLVEECLLLNGCPTGDAKITEGHDLPARYIIHTVGPIWHGGDKNEEKLLAGCYKKCMELAREYKITSIAFPAISTGVYRFPVDLAAAISLQEVQKGLEDNPVLAKVVLVCFNPATCSAYEKLLGAG